MINTDVNLAQILRDVFVAFSEASSGICNYLAKENKAVVFNAE